MYFSGACVISLSALKVRVFLRSTRATRRVAMQSEAAIITRSEGGAGPWMGEGFCRPSPRTSVPMISTVWLPWSCWNDSSVVVAVSVAVYGMDVPSTLTVHCDVVSHVSRFFGTPT